MTILSRFFGRQLPSTPASKRIVLVDKEVGIAFPDFIASMEYGDREQYDNPGLGYSVRYNSGDAVKADIYVYDKNYLDIAEGASSERVLEEFAEVTGVFSIMEARGMYLGVRELAMQRKRCGKSEREYLWARYEYQQAPAEGVTCLGNRVSDTFLTGVKGRFFKIRITACRESFSAWEELFDRFVEETTALLDLSNPSRDGLST